MPAAPLQDVYERQYAAAGEEARRYGAWRQLCGAGKAEHVAELVGALPVAPRTVAEIGCGDGVLLTLLARRGVGEVHHGYDISELAVAKAAVHPEIDRVEVFDGETLPVADGAYDLGVLSHVLEHVPEPLPLLREVGRGCRTVVVEVPLEGNLTASRPAARAGREAIGHLHCFSRADVRSLVGAAGLRVVAELSDPLPLAVHAYFAETRKARAKAIAKVSARRAVFAVAPLRAERLFTVHYAALCVSG